MDRVVRLDVSHQVEIPLERDVGIMAPLNEDLHGAERLGLVDLGADLLEGQRVPLLMLRPAIEGAEPAIGDAHVRVVDVAVDDVRDDAVRMLRLAHAVRLDAELEEGRVLVEVEQITHCRRGQESGVRDQAAGRKASVPFGTLPRSTSRPKKVVRPARWGYDKP